MWLTFWIQLYKLPSQMWLTWNSPVSTGRIIPPHNLRRLRINPDHIFKGPLPLVFITHVTQSYPIQGKITDSKGGWTCNKDEFWYMGVSVTTELLCHDIMITLYGYMDSIVPLLHFTDLLLDVLSTQIDWPKVFADKIWSGGWIR